MPLTKNVGTNWVSFGLVFVVVIGLGITIVGQLGLNTAVSNTPTQPTTTNQPKSLETIQIATTGTKTQSIKDQYTINEAIIANGLEIKILGFNKFIYTSSVNQVQEVYCAIGLEMTNISDSEIKILPDFDFELVDGSASGGILLTTPLIKSIDSRPELELVEFQTAKLEPKKVFSKSIPFVCQENPDYQFIIKTTQFQNNPLFKVVNIKLN